MAERPVTTKRQEEFKFMLDKDCSKFTKTSPANKANYLSWSYAWQEFKKVYPFAYVVTTKNDHGTFELKDDFGTYFVEVTVCNGGEKSNGEYIEESQTVQLPIMDNKHKPQRAEAYEYTTKFGTKTVAGATSFDTNYALQRAKTKAISDFGLGLYIYHGETIPAESDDFVGAVEQANKTTLKDAENEIWSYLISLGASESTNSKVWAKIKVADYFKDEKISDKYKA